MTDPVIHTALTPDLLRDLLQTAGYRVERAEAPQGPEGSATPATPPVLRSATAGMAFDLRFANPLAAGSDLFADAVFQAAFRVEGELPLALTNTWNAGRRFGRLFLRDGVLALEMDVGALGGVTPNHLRAQIEIWDQLVRQLITYLREEVGKLAAPAPAPAPASAPSGMPAPETPHPEPEAGAA